MPVALARLRELIDLAATEGVGDIDIIEDGTHIRILRSAGAPVRKGASAAKIETVAATATADIFPAPMFGVCHLTPAPGAKPFVAVGDLVAKGQQLCLIEAMKMFNAVHADRTGRIVAILAEAGTEVANGQPLFRIVAG